MLHIAALHDYVYEFSCSHNLTIWPCKLNLWSITGWHCQTIDSSNWWMPIDPSVYVKIFIRHMTTKWDTNNQIFYISISKRYPHHNSTILQAANKTCNLSDSSVSGTSLPIYSTLDWFLSEKISVPLFWNEDRAISILTAMTKLHRWKSQLWRTPLFVGSSGESSSPD